jgi:murein L,D-transpeptidase YcbB/YkuD
MNRAFLDQGNYQVLNKAGKIVDPGTVNWRVLGPGNFPYTLRQSTGCDNALGLIKLNFDNPYSVYLHDTPNKMAFLLGKRFLSHGCMRMEKPFELARDLLPVNHIAIDTLDEKGNIRNKVPVTVKADTPTPLVVWYNLAGTDTDGQLRYYEDVYGKEK